MVLISTSLVCLPFLKTVEISRSRCFAHEIHSYVSAHVGVIYIPLKALYASKAAERHKPMKNIKPARVGCEPLPLTGLCITTATVQIRDIEEQQEPKPHLTNINIQPLNTGYFLVSVCLSPAPAKLFIRTLQNIDMNSGEHCQAVIY